MVDLWLANNFLHQRKIHNFVIQQHLNFLIVSQALILEAGDFSRNFEAFGVFERDIVDNIYEFLSMS